MGLKEKEALLNELDVAKRIQLVLEMVQKSIDLVEKAMSVRRQHRAIQSELQVL